MNKAEYIRKQRRFDALFDKWFCPQPSITPDEIREMDRLRDDLTAYDRHHAFLHAVNSGEVSPIS